MGKRIISVLLTGLMLILTLTGCGTNELGYLSLAKETGKLTQYKFLNTTQVEVSKTVAGEDYNINLELKGSANVEDLNSMYLNLDVLIKVNDMGNEFPINFVISDNQVYVSKNAIIEVIKLQEKFDETTENPKVIDELYNIELKDTEYILISDLNEYYNGIEYNANYNDMYDHALDYITSAFKGFDSKLITKINNGYAIELTAESTVSFIERLITYVSENRDQVFDETVKYMENIFNDMNIEDIEGMTEADKQTAIEELKASRQEFYDFIDEAVLFIETEEFKSIENMLDRSYIKEEIFKKGSSYVQNIEGELVVEDIIMGNFVTSTELTEAKVESKEVSENYITLESLEELYNKTENKINPVNKIELSWYPESTNAEINKYRLDGKTAWDYKEYALIDERVYLPLRYIGESFGEEVAWDDVNKKAYVVRNNEKIDMTGELINNTTMVKVRDFEKLGYKIEYQQVDGLSIATIVK
jgi:hypothetical protein